MFHCLTKFKVGGGEKVSFWNDRRASYIPFSLLYPNIYAASSTKFSSVADNFKGEEFGFEKRFLGCDRWILEGDLQLLNVQTLTVEPDKLLWTDGSDCYKVKVCHHLILNFLLKFVSNGVFHFNWESVWLPSVQSKVPFLTWLIVKNRVHTETNFDRRGLD